MTVDIAQVRVRVVVDDSGVENGLTSTKGKVEQSAGAFNRAGLSAKKYGDSVQGAAARAVAANNNVAGSAERAARSFSSIQGAAARAMVVIGALAGSMAVGALTRYADAWSDMQSRVGAAIRDMAAAPQMMSRIVDIANASYSSLDQTVEVYSRNVAVLRDLGKGAEDAAKFTESLNHMLVLTATRGERASSVQNALSKAMAVGKLQAEGLETILANGGEVAQALANELGTTVNGLRSLVSQGKITGTAIANAIIKPLEDVRTRAAEMPATIGDAFTRIQTNLTAYVGTMDKTLGASEAVASALIVLADNIDRIGAYAGTAAVAFGTYYVAALIKANAATITLAGSLAFLRAALIRIGIGALVVAAGELVYQFSRMVEATGSFTGALAQMGQRANLIFKGVEFGFLFLTESMRSAWYGAMADILSATEQTFGPMLRMMGVSAEQMSASIDSATYKASEWGEIAASSGRIAIDQFQKAFAEIEMPDVAPFTEETLKAASAVGEVDKASKRAANAFKGIVDSAQEFIEAQRLEASLIGMSEQAANALRYEFELLNDAKRAGLTLTRADRDGFKALAEAMAEAEAKTKKLRDEADQLRDAWQPVVSLIGDLFSKPLKDVDELLDKVMGAFAQIGNANLNAGFERFFGNANGGSDASGTVRSIERGVEKGATKGGWAGIVDGFSSLFGGQQSGQAQGGLAGAMSGMLGAGVGGLGMGYQSQSPVMGALGGAMSGFAAGGPVGAVIGGIAGLIGGVLGNAKKQKEELEKARKELEQQMGAITELIAAATGNFLGEFEKSLVKTSDEFSKAIALAEKARNHSLAKELRDAQDEFFRTISQRWNSGFEGMIASLESGHGLEGAFVSGMTAIEDMREALVGFVNDAKMFAESGGDLAGYIEDKLAVETGGRLFNQYTTLDAGPLIGSNVSQDYKDAVERWASEIEKHQIKVFTSGIAATKDDAGTPVTQVFDTVDGLKAKLMDFGVAFDEMGQIVRAATGDQYALAGSVERARQAAIKSALASISGAEDFTELERSILKLEGAAASLPSLLMDLGMSAEQAAEAIERELNVAIDKLRHTATMDVQRSINDLAGFGYLNEFADAQTSYQNRVRDLAAVGGDTGLAFQELALRLRQISGDAGLTDEKLRELVSVFPEISAGVLAAMGGGNSGSAASDAKAALDQARADLRSAYEEEKRAIEQVISRHQALVKSLRSFLDDLRLDSNLSPLDPYERFQEAQRQFQDTAALALTGDADALAKLEDASRAYLTEAKGWWGTSTQYFEVFKQVEAIVAQALGVSEGQLTEAERQLAALDQQISGLIDINTSVLTVNDALTAMKEAEAAHEAAQAARDAYQAQLFQQMLALMGAQREDGGASVDVARAMAYLSGNADVMAAIKGGQTFGTGSTDIGVLAQAHWERHGQFENRMTGFASGGFTGFGGINQVAGVVHGQEFVAHAEATRRWRPQLEAMNAGTFGTGRSGGDNSEIVNALKAEIGALREEVRVLTQTTAAGAQGQIAATQGTTQAVNRQSDDNRRAQFRRTA